MSVPIMKNEFLESMRNELISQNVPALLFDYLDEIIRIEVERHLDQGTREAVDSILEDYCVEGNLVKTGRRV